MGTDRWHCWGYTDHQGTLIISALMISVHVPSEECRLPALLDNCRLHASGAAHARLEWADVI
ncbi:unnamed protein product, partial [Staurois parvus]